MEIQIINIEGAYIAIQKAATQDLQIGATVYISSKGKWEQGYITHIDNGGIVLVDFMDDTRDEYSGPVKLWIDSPELCVYTTKELYHKARILNRAEYLSAYSLRLLNKAKQHLAGIMAAEGQDTLIDKIEVYKMTCSDFAEFMESESKKIKNDKKKGKI